MLPLINPPVPPALIQPLVFAQIPSSPDSGDFSSRLRLKTNEGSDVLLAQSAPTSQGEIIPPVVEFYYSDPNEVPPPPQSDSSSPTGYEAQLLGKPISVHENGAPDATRKTDKTVISPTSPIAAAQVILGLNYTRLPQVLITHKRNGQKRKFALNWRKESSPVAQNRPQIQGELLRDQSSTSEEKDVNVIELIADQQEYDSVREIVTARGNVSMRLSNGLLTADRLQINLPQKLAVAEGKVILTRGDQVLRGDRFEYYFVEDSGIVFNANGEINQASTERDFSPTLSSGTTSATKFLTLNDRLAFEQPLQRVTTGEGYQFVFGTQKIGAPEGGTSTGQSRGQINRLRFQAEKLKFEGNIWKATDIRLTNDPYSPPELEVRANEAELRPVDPLVSELVLSNSRLVFDQNVSIPTQNRLVFDRRKRSPSIVSFGYDGEERGGLFLERGFSLIDNRVVSFDLTPQYLLQKALFPDAFPTANPTEQSLDPLSPSVFGLVADLDVRFNQRTRLQGIASFASLNLEEAADYLRSKLQLQQKVGDINNPYFLTFEYNYRERMFNGSLGYQTVQNSIGALFLSPAIPLGDTGINLNYQASLQHINSQTDVPELIDPNGKNNLTTLVRTQGAVSLNRPFLLWYAQPLPATPEEGLRYTPTPVMPYLQLITGLTGVTSYYSNGDNQPSLTGTVGILGQIGHFSRPFFDYTGFNLTYSQGMRGDPSPFLFDRFVDQRVLSYGVTQQLYGPIRLGFQSSYSLDTNKEISTDYIIEWSRRTYSLLLRYNPILELGSISLRISDFNWTGNPGLFEGTLIRPVVEGVTR